MLIAAILGMIAITTTAAIARVALHKSTQTVHFVQEWHTDADVLWTTQEKKMVESWPPKWPTFNNLLFY